MWDQCRRPRAMPDGPVRPARAGDRLLPIRSFGACRRRSQSNGPKPAPSGRRRRPSELRWTQMLRVYLDQNKWVDLSRGFESEDAGGAKFRDVALAVEAAVEAGHASFPLSVAHIFETWQRREWD